MFGPSAVQEAGLNRALERLAAVALFCLGIALGAGSLAAQTREATVSGLVTGPDGEPVGGAHVVAVHAQSGVEREAVSSAAGQFLLVDMAPGTWQFRVSAEGYLTSAAATLFLEPALGQTLDLKLIRDPSMAAERDASPSMLTALPAGVLDVGNSGQRAIRYSTNVAGSMTLVLDSVDMTPLISRSQLGLSHFLLVPNSFEQVRLTAAQFTADSNLTPGGQPAIVSRAGGNDWHGEVFGIPRNDLLSSNAGFSNGNLKLESTEYGGALSGPIRRNRSHFYLVYAGLRQTVGEVLTGYVPTPAFRASVVAANPALAPLIKAYPAGNAPLVGSTDSMTFLGTGNQVDNEDALSLRLDEELPAPAGRDHRDSLFFRVSLDSALTHAPVAQGGTYLQDLLMRKAHPLSGELGWSHRFDAMLSQDARLSYVRGTYESAYKGTIGLPYSLAVAGFTTLTGDQSTYGASNSYAAQDGMAWIHGRQEVLAGGEVRLEQLNQRNSDAGAIAYSSFAGLEANHVNTASYSQALTTNGLEEWQAYGWAQDNWRVSSTLLVGVGLRYQFFNQLHEEHRKAIPFDFVTCGVQGFCAPGASFGRMNGLDIDPRVSLAWAPEHGPAWLRSHVVARAGGGIYHSDGLLSDQSQPIYNEVENFYLSSAQQTGLSYPIAPYLPRAKGIASALGMARNRDDAYAIEWSGSLQSVLPGRLLTTASYFGAQGTHLQANTYVNLIDPATRLRPHPAFGQIPYRTSTGSSTFNAMAVLVQRDLRSGLQLTAGFNWAHEIDDGVAGDGLADPPENPVCPRCDRASGDTDVRHSAGLYSIYEIPFGDDRTRRSSSRWLNRVAGNWDLLNQFTARTALPVNVTLDRSAADVATGYTVAQRPDRVPGVSLRPPGGPTVEDWINPAAFTTVQGLYGDSGRNVARGPAAWQLDTSLLREFSLPRELSMVVRADVQNIFNHAQYGQPLSDWSTKQFGEIVSLANTNRVGNGGVRALFLSFDVNF
jgi:hypothetical protein